MKRTLLSAIFLISAPFAQASFDLMYVLDGATKSVHRVDPINGISLGRFGAGFLNNPIAMSLDASNNVWVLDGMVSGSSRIRKFNGSTGDYLGGWATPYSSGTNAKIIVTSTNVFVTGGANYSYAYLFNYTLAGVIVDDGYLGGSATSSYGQGVATLGGNAYWSGYQTSTGVQKLYKTPISTTWNGTTVNSSAEIAGFNSSNLISHNGKLIFNPSNSGGYVYDANLNLVSSFIMPGFNTIKGLASGHEDLVHIAGMTNTGFAVAKYYSGSNDYLSPTVIAGTGITDVRDIAVQVAPEPASMIALTFGLVAIIKRRKS